MRGFLIFLLLSAPVLLAINVNLLHRLFSSEGELHQHQKYSATLNQELDKQRDILRENAQLNAEVVDLKSGHEVIAEIARYHLGLLREGEIFIYSDGSEDQLQVENQSTASPLTEESSTR